VGGKGGAVTADGPGQFAYDAAPRENLAVRIFGGVGQSVASLESSLLRPFLAPLVLLIILVVAMTVLLGRVNRIAGAP
jgi:hypothetical protein